VSATACSRGLEVAGGGTGVVSHAGLVLRRQLVDRASLLGICLWLPSLRPPDAVSAVNAVYAGYWGFTISQVATAVTADRFEIRCGREQGNVMESPTASVTTSVSKSTVRFPAVTVPTS
jgi:hypothetical protein